MTPDEKQAHEEKHERSGRAVGGWVVDDRQSGWATGVGTETLLKHVYKTLCTAQAGGSQTRARILNTCTYETGRGLEDRRRGASLCRRTWITQLKYKFKQLYLDFINIVMTLSPD